MYSSIASAPSVRSPHASVTVEMEASGRLVNGLPAALVSRHLSGIAFPAFATFSSPLSTGWEKPPKE